MLQAKTQFITTAEAAEIIGCTERHVSLLIREGRIEAEPFGGNTWAVKKKSAEEYAAIPQRTGRPRLRKPA